MYTPRENARIRNKSMPVEKHGAGEEESYLICQSMQGPCQPIHGCCKGQIGV